MSLADLRVTLVYLLLLVVPHLHSYFAIKWFVVLSFLNVGSLIVVYIALLGTWGFKRAISVKFACLLAKFPTNFQLCLFKICEIDLNRYAPF